jgi:ribosomal protein S18
MICTEVESLSTPQFKVRQEYDKAFKAIELFGLDAETFVSLLAIDEKIDYKDLAKLRKCMTERAKILPRRVTGTCAYHQRELTVAIKRARHIALLPYISD